MISAPRSARWTHTAAQVELRLARSARLQKLLLLRLIMREARRHLAQLWINVQDDLGILGWRWTPWTSATFAAFWSFVLLAGILGMTGEAHCSFPRCR